MVLIQALASNLTRKFKEYRKEHSSLMKLTYTINDLSREQRNFRY